MGALIEFFIQLALLRRKPQDLPASPVLLVLLGVASMALGTAAGAEDFGGYRAAFGANLFDLTLSLLFLFAVLQITGYLSRWLQTSTAVLGLSILASVFVFTLVVLGDAVRAPDVAGLLALIVFIWLHIAIGHVLRHALGVPLAAGVIIIFGYTLFSQALIWRVFPPLVSN